MIGVIADDLTGAAEIGAVGLRHGLRAEIVLFPFAGSSNRRKPPLASSKRKGETTNAGGRLANSFVPSKTDLLCIDTESRSCTAAEAGRRAACAADLLIAAGADWIYKKTDSVLRGQVTAELEAILRRLQKHPASRACRAGLSRQSAAASEVRRRPITHHASGLPLALLVPANPSLGRVIRRGRYFVHSRPLHETEFAHDPEHPRRSARVLELLAKPQWLEVCVRRCRDGLPLSGIVVGEAQTTAHLKAWALKARVTGRLQIIPAGGAEFFAALLAAAGHQARASGPESAQGRRTGRELFVCGSISQSSREFVNRERERGTPVFSLPEALMQGKRFTAAKAETIERRAAEAFHSRDRVILRIGLRPVRRRSLARRLSSHLAQVAERLLRRGRITHVYAEGGATAVELVRRMGWQRLIVLHELAPGVATLAVACAPSLRLTLKPGSYSWPNKLHT